MDSILGISILDIVVLSSYFILITYIGVWTRRKIKSTGDFFMGNRGFGKLLMIAQAFGVGTHTDQPVSVSGAAYTTGLAGIWYQWLWMFSTPFYWVIGPIYRRLRYVTMADFFFERYGKSLGIFYTFIGGLFFCMNIGIMLKGTGVTIEALTGGALPETPIILVATLLFVIYGLAGGLIAAVITDLIQGVLILILSFLLLPFALDAAGGISTIHQSLPEHMFSLVAPYEVTLFFIVMVVLNGLVGIVVQPHHMAVGGTAKTEMASRAGWTYGNFIKRLATLGWAFMGVFAAFLYPGLTEGTRELAFGVAARNLLPMGLVGLMMAALIAAVMSTCDAFMVHAAALFTKNVYEPYINTKATDRDLLKIGRMASVVVVVGGVFFAFVFPSVVHGLMELWKVTAYLGISFWFGVIWKRANRYGAWASALSMACAALFTGNVLEWSLPNQIALYLPLGIIIMIIVSRFTRPEPEENLRQFYMLLDTPVGQEDRLRQANVSIKLEGVSQGRRMETSKVGISEKEKDSYDEDGLIVVDLLSLKKRFSWRRYRIDILGFGAAVLLVVAIILLAIFLAGIGG